MKTLQLPVFCLLERIAEGIKPDEPMIKKKHGTAREWIRALGERILGKRIYFHLLRHSSATFYADKLNRQQLCLRYGWKFSSDMPDIYINRAGVDMKDVEEKFDNIERIKIKEQNDELKTKIAVITEREKMASKEIEQLRKEFENFKLLVDLKPATKEEMKEFSRHEAEE